MPARPPRMEYKPKLTPFRAFVLTVGVASMIAACTAVKDDATQETTFDKAVNSQFEKYYHGNGVSVIRDLTTGCEYLGYYGEYLSPRLNADGKQICGKSNGRISGEIEGKAN